MAFKCSPRLIYKNSHRFMSPNWYLGIKAGEVRDIKGSLQLLAKNSYCRTMMLSKAAHDFPMRCANELNPIIKRFFEDLGT